MNCTRCEGTGFLNLEQVEDETRKLFDETGDHGIVLDWIYERDSAKERLGCSCHLAPPCSACVDYDHDVQICDCCGDGRNNWHGTPGEHNPNEPNPECA